jgi:CBS-domain-containing membrane protein
MNELKGRVKVSAFMKPKDKLITITPDTLVEEAVQLMHKHKIRYLPVVEGKELYGVFTETDALGLLVDLFGFKQKSTRLTVALEDRPGKMLRILEVLKRHNVNVVSIASPTFIVEGKRLAHIRIRTEKYKNIIKELEKAGYPVLSIGEWPSV